LVEPGGAIVADRAGEPRAAHAAAMKSSLGVGRSNPGAVPTVDSRHGSRPARSPAAWSRLRRDRAFALLTITTLALGIGADTAMFSLVRGVLLQPLPYHQPERLVAIWGQDLAEATWLSLQEVVSYGSEARSFTTVAGYQEIDNNLTGGQEPERVRAAAVTPNLFETVGVAALIGRVPSPSEAGRTPDAILLSHPLWQRRFGGAPEVVGTGIQVNGRVRVVAGVMPAGFRLPGDYRAQRPVEAWLPEPVDPDRLGAWGSPHRTAVRSGAGPAPLARERGSGSQRRGRAATTSRARHAVRAGPATDYAGPDDVVRLFRQIDDRLAQLPGVWGPGPGACCRSRARSGTGRSGSKAGPTSRPRIRTRTSTRSRPAISTRCACGSSAAARSRPPTAKTRCRWRSSTRRWPIGIGRVKRRSAASS
jgi:hypothetical protein